MDPNSSERWPRISDDFHTDMTDLSGNSSSGNWMLYVKLVLSLSGSLFGGYGLVGLLRDRCKRSEVVWKLTLIVFSAPVVVFVFFSICAEFKFCERFVADAVSFGCVAGMLLKLVTRPYGDKIVKLIVQQVNGDKHDVWLNTMDITVGEARNQIAETIGVTPVNRVSIESGKGKPVDDLTLQFFDLIDEAHKSTDFFGFCTASCYISVAEPVQEESAPDIEWKEKERGKKFNPFKLLLDSRAKYGDPFTIIARSATSDDAKKFHISAVDRFAGAAPGNAPLFVQLKIYAWSSTNVDGGLDGEGKAGSPQDWENNSEMASSVHTVSTRKSRGVMDVIFQRKVTDEGRLRGKPIHHGDQVVIEADGR